MVRKLAAAAALAAALPLAAAPASAHAAQRGCLNLPECLAITGAAGQPGWVSVQWLRNDDFWFARSVAKCNDGTRNSVLELGGWVSALDTPSETDCPNGFPNLIGAAYDWKDEETGSVFTRHWVTIPIRARAVRP